MHLGAPGGRTKVVQAPSLGGSQEPCGESLERSGLILELVLLRAGAYTGDLAEGPSHLHYPLML